MNGGHELTLCITRYYHQSDHLSMDITDLNDMLSEINKSYQRTVNAFESLIDQPEYG